MKKKYDDMTPGEAAIESLKQAIDYEKGKKVKGIRIRKLEIAPVPHYKSKKIKKIRNDIGLTQKVFADAIGVSVKTLEAWETGTNEPSGAAQRLLSIIDKDHKALMKYEIVKIN